MEFLAFCPEKSVPCARTRAASILDFSFTIDRII